MKASLIDCVKQQVASTRASLDELEKLIGEFAEPAEGGQARCLHDANQHLAGFAGKLSKVIEKARK